MDVYHQVIEFMESQGFRDFYTPIEGRPESYSQKGFKDMLCNCCVIGRPKHVYIQLNYIQLGAEETNAEYILDNTNDMEAINKFTNDSLFNFKLEIL